MWQPECMRNIYSITINVEAVRRLFAVEWIDASAGKAAGRHCRGPVKSREQGQAGRRSAINSSLSKLRLWECGSQICSNL